MNINIQTKGFILTEAIRDYVERHVKFALAHVNDRIRQVHVRLYDINGPRGGEDKCCQIQVSLNGAQTVLAQDTESDLYFAIDRAARRVWRAVTRRVARPGRRIRPSWEVI